MLPFYIKAFYTLRPLVPRNLQIFLRRRLAKYQRWRNLSHWPIDPASTIRPDGWNGWPDGKQFAFVLSHDVESQKGYHEVLQLAEIEKELGFRSTFNFVPERYGEISLDLIEDLKRMGFDVGVHGLKHDGKLYFTKKIFNKRARKINHYLKKWQSRGFSSPSMHHKLEWLKGLNIDYSISTFDTDPFEPQPDGVGTIFPMWIHHDSDYYPNGHVELPYTLPQDSTLFIILEEPNINIWRKKIDWIAEHGGMALVNTHPDFMNFKPQHKKSLHYSIDLYTDLLQFVKENYKEAYFHGTARKIAEHCRTIKLKG